MAIQQTKKQSDLEKRLQILRRQVYGKNPENSERLRKPADQHVRMSDHLKLRYSDIPSSSESFRTDLSYLYQDLFKIFILSSLAIGAQIILFILSQKHILNLKLF